MDCEIGMTSCGPAGFLCRFAAVHASTARPSPANRHTVHVNTWVGSLAILSRSSTDLFEIIMTAIGRSS